jgi:hypothetical protein
VALIVKTNPTWRDLAEDFGFEPLIKKVDRHPPVFLERRR